MLLDSGSTPVTRRAAALQIGEIQKLHPHEFNNLLRKVIFSTRVFFYLKISYDAQVSSYLSSKSWETRIAAGQAVEAIAANVKQWDPQFVAKREPAEGEGGAGDGEGSPVAMKPDLLSFGSFDIKQVQYDVFVGFALQIEHTTLFRSSFMGHHSSPPRERNTRVWRMTQISRK